MIFTFVDEVSHIPEEPADSDRDNFVIIGRTWYPSVFEWVTLNRAGYNVIICSKIEPYRSDDDDIDEVIIRPEFLHDLSRRGQFQVEL